jgi:hypothetical protein
MGVGSAEAMGVGSAEAMGVGSAEAMGVGSAEAMGVGFAEAMGVGFAGAVGVWSADAGCVSGKTAGVSCGAAVGSVEGVVGSGEVAKGFVAAPPEAGAGSSARAVPTNAEAATEAATRASNNPRGLSDRRRRLGIRLLRTTTHLAS